VEFCGLVGWDWEVNDLKFSDGISDSFQENKKNLFPPSLLVKCKGSVIEDRLLKIDY
jgi:hypothetical protein